MHSKNKNNCISYSHIVWDLENIPVFRSGKSMDDGGFLYGCGLETAPAGSDSPEELFSTPLKKQYDITKMRFIVTDTA